MTINFPEVLRDPDISKHRRERLFKRQLSVVGLTGNPIDGYAMEELVTCRFYWNKVKTSCCIWMAGVSASGAGSCQTEAFLRGLKGFGAEVEGAEEVNRGRIEEVLTLVAEQLFSPDKIIIIKANP